MGFKWSAVQIRAPRLSGKNSPRAIAQTQQGQVIPGLGLFSPLIPHFALKRYASDKRSIVPCPEDRNLPLNLLLVGARGFEPPTSASQTLRAKPNCATPRVDSINYLGANVKLST